MTAPKPPAIKELKIGPFSGGINRYSDPAAIADSELVDCVNFDIDLDGSLKSRPPWGSSFGSSYSTVFSAPATLFNTQVLGSFVYYGNKLAVITYQETANGVSECKLIYYWIDGPRAGETAFIKSDANIANPFTDVVRYKDILYFVRANGGGGSWTFNVTDDGGGTWADISFPAAVTAALYKERMWLVNGSLGTNKSRLYFSDVATPQTFQPASFFDIRPGDGETLNDLIVYQDNIFLFKNNSIWVFTYDTQVTQAVLQQVHDNLGTDNAWSTVLYENVIYFYKDTQVYQIANFDITRISTKLPFENNRELPAGTTETWATGNGWKFPQTMSLVGDRLVVRYYNRLYIYHLRLRSWTRWTSNSNPVHYMGQIIPVESAGATNRLSYSQYISGTALNMVPIIGATNVTVIHVSIMNDTYDDVSREYAVFDILTPVYKDITMNLSTKIYDIGISHRFKRLLHWGIDVVTGRPVTGNIKPFSIAYRVTWDQLVTFRWDQLQTWGYPLFEQPIVTQDAAVDGGIYRRFVRFPKSLRFRLIQFTLELNTVGNVADGPARVYTLTAFVAQKQLAPLGVN